MTPRDRHRALEDLLDALPSPADPDFRTVFASVNSALLRHYGEEEVWMSGRPFDKMRAQHDEVRELGREIARSLACGQIEDAGRLTARFLALARHNMIEEERDVFPYYHRK